MVPPPRKIRVACGYGRECRHLQENSRTHEGFGLHVDTEENVNTEKKVHFVMDHIDDRGHAGMETSVGVEKRDSETHGGVGLHVDMEENVDTEKKVHFAMDHIDDKGHAGMETSVGVLRGESSLFVAMDDELMRAILVDEASTRTMNLFGMWIENKLPPLPLLEKVLVVDSTWYSMSAKPLDTFLSRFFWQIDVSADTLSYASSPLFTGAIGPSLLCVSKQAQKAAPFAREKSYLLYMDSLEVTDAKGVLGVAVQCS